MSAYRVRYALSVAAALLAAIVTACATTEVVSSWKDPAFNNVSFRKALVVFQSADPAIRRVAEDEMARDIPNSTPSHTLFNDTEVRDIERVKERVRREGFDSAVIMRIVGVEREVSFVPGAPHPWPAYYHRFWGYWGWGWGTVYAPGYLRSDRIVRIATHVYSVTEDKLVWASQSETFNPTSLRAAIAETVRVTAKQTGDVLRARG